MVPRVLLLAAVIIWGWTFVATKILVAELDPVEILGLRLAIGLPILGCVLLAKRTRLQFTREDVRPLLLGGIIFTLHFLVQIAGIETTTATNTGWIISLSPLVLVALSAIILRERIGWRTLAGIAIATLGVLLLVSRGSLADFGWLRSVGDWLVLASAHTWAFYTVVTRDLARRRDPLAVTFAILLITTVLTAIPFAISANFESIRSLSPGGLAALLYLAIPGLALGQWFWQEGVASVGAAHAGIYLYVEPLATLILAVPLLKEPFGPAVAMGGGLVLAGVYMGQMETKRPRS